MSTPAAIPTASDTIVESVLEKFLARSHVGQRKYGTTLDRTDTSFLAWIQHTQEELMDAVLYLEKMKQLLSGAPSRTSPPPAR